MPDVSVNTDINNDVNSNDAIKKLAKIQESLKKAKNKYCKKRYAADPEFRKKQIEQVAISQKKNPEKYKEYKKQYMREYRARKKTEKIELSPNKDTSLDITSDIHNEKVIEITNEIADKLILNLETNN
jgi:hypothetical protein